MIVTHKRQDVPRTEKGLTQALMRHFDWRANRCYPNVHLFPWESDLLVVTKSGYATEVEVKATRADWNADALKDKWKPSRSFYDPTGQDYNRTRGWDFVKSFYYAVPVDLLDKVPEHVQHTTGLLAIHPQGQISIKRPASRLKAKPLTPQHLESLHGSMYFRFLTQYMEKP